MNVNELFKRWRMFACEDDDVASELERIVGDEDAIYERFYQDLSFGTAGLRGVLGAGTNRMNIYTVRRATQGFANYLLKKFENPTMAIAYDSRIKSDVFSKEAAQVLAANEIKVYMYPELMPTPMLSFAIRQLHCSGGINITASHNPKEYNGYKAYLDDGCQIGEDAANAIFEEIKNTDPFDDISTMDFDEAMDDGLISYIGEEVTDIYFNLLKESMIDKEALKKNNMRIIYTPLCGAGNKPVRHMLKLAGFDNLSVVKSQEKPDGTFASCPYPNPEFREALIPGIEMALKEKSEILIATDPDSDRVGAVLFDENGNERQLTGNQVGILMCYYMLNALKEQGKLPERPVVIESIVSTPIIHKIVESFGGVCYETLTGFKNLCGKMAELDEEGKLSDFVFAFEESCGYLPVTYVRDKDAVASSLLLSEMACHYKAEGRTLISVLDEIYEKYGYHKEVGVSFEFKGVEEGEKLKKLVAGLFEDPFKEVGPYKVVSHKDYKNSRILENGEIKPFSFPKSNVLAATLDNGARLTIRPSGTEPKLKAYIMTQGKNEAEASEIAETIKKGLNSIIFS